jgi:hypothetical protein
MACSERQQFRFEACAYERICIAKLSGDIFLNTTNQDYVWISDLKIPYLGFMIFEP